MLKPDQQIVKDNCYNHIHLNQFIELLRNEALKFIDKTPASQLTDKRLKEKITVFFVNARKASTERKL